MGIEILRTSFITTLVILLPATVFSQTIQWSNSNSQLPLFTLLSERTSSHLISVQNNDSLVLDRSSQTLDPEIVFAENLQNNNASLGNNSASGGGGSGGADPTDPSAILTQFQIQNVYTPETYNSSGHSNSLILQPVLPFPVAMPLLKEFIPNHVIRPTLPIITPTANPDGLLGTQSGIGDLTIADIGVIPVEGFGNLLLGYTAILPTATDSQLGLREWQLGPAAGFIYKEIPKTIFGVIYQQPFSFESNAQQVLITPVLVRQLPNKWYIRWGELNWIFNTENGDYNIPINVAVGKVTKFGNQPVNIFIQPFYTPEDLRQGPAAEWGVKLNVTFLFPEMKFGPLLGNR